MVARTGSELNEVAGEIRKLGQNGICINADLMEDRGARRAVKESINGLGKVDILVNNAGGYRLFTNDLSHQVNVSDMTEEEWQLVMNRRVFYTVVLRHVALSLLGVVRLFCLIRVPHIFWMP